ncbi:PIN domain-containing protein [Candidatus Pacearchaeota archaeon]|nr:PIN domain-containing protein [Candidatus Pacearchaeota archaeon]
MMQEEDGIKIYFWDTYAIIELLRGNPNYSKYFNEEVTITIFNLAEIYWSALNDLVLGNPEEIYEKYSQCVVEIPDETLKEAIKFRKANKKKDLSYTDCIGYVYALKHNMVFLIRDKEFQSMKNVEFAK